MTKPSGASGHEAEASVAAESSLTAQLRKKLPIYLAGVALLFAQQALMAKRDFLVRDAVDAAVGGLASPARTAAIAMLLVSVSAAIVRVASRITVFTAGRNVEYELRKSLLDRLHKLGPAFFRKMPTGDVMSRATNDLTQVRLLLGFGILNIVSSAFALVSALYVMATVSVRLMLASLVTFPLLMLVTRGFSARMFSRVRDNQEALGKMSDRVLSSLAGVRVVRSFALERSEATAFNDMNQLVLEKSLALAKLRGSIGPLMGAISSLGILVVFFYGGRLIASGEITAGEFLSFWLALLRLSWPLLAIGFVAAIVQRGRAAYERLREILVAVPDVRSGSAPAPERVRGELRVEHLSFAHGDNVVLDDVGFEVHAGGSIAIVGTTGSGKSTLAALLPRLLPTPRGAVFLDGLDVCDLPLRTLRASIGYAQQDAFLFSTTVTRNIGYSLDEVDGHESTEVIRQAASEAEVLAEVEGLPEGFDTVVGERGVQLSGGQRQRVALARALLRDSPVIVLDDPLSAVDARTEAAILESIERQKSRRTVVLITNRVAAAKRCDSIVVLDRGRVVERGTHAQLARTGGIYSAFVEEQAILADLAALDEAMPVSA